MSEHVNFEELLQPINLGLKPRGRSVQVAELKAPEAVLKLEGFCCGGDCACGSAFQTRITQLVQSRYPEFTSVTFIFS